MTIRVLIVDDSPLIRQLLSALLQADPMIEVVGTANDPFMAREKIKLLNPDVITLDIEMPLMDGLTFLEKLMALRPMPVVVVSSLTQKGADAALRALELGAVDYVSKPLSNIRSSMGELAAELVDKVKTAAGSRPRGQVAKTSQKSTNLQSQSRSVERIIAIGASTGGVEAIQTILMQLPSHAPAILIAQHMPPGFTSSFARRLNEQCPMTVVEATDGCRVLPGHVYIAPGALHLKLARHGSFFECSVGGGEPVGGHRPSVNVLFESVADAAGKLAVGFILTGMGRDGAHGLLALRRAGGRTFGQTEGSCLIYGMPKAAMELGAVESEIPLDQIADRIIKLS